MNPIDKKIAIKDMRRSYRTNKRRLIKILKRQPIGEVFLASYLMRESAARYIIKNIRSVFSSDETHHFEDWFGFTFLIDICISFYRGEMGIKHELWNKIEQIALNLLQGRKNGLIKLETIESLAEEAKRCVRLLNRVLLLKSQKAQFFESKNNLIFLLDISNPIMKSPEKDVPFELDSDYFKSLPDFNDVFSLKYYLELLYKHGSKEWLQTRIITKKLRQVYAGRLLKVTGKEAKHLYDLLKDLISILEQRMEVDEDDSGVIFYESFWFMKNVEYGKLDLINHLNALIFDNKQNRWKLTLLKSNLMNYGCKKDYPFNSSLISYFESGNFIIPFYTLNMIAISLLSYVEGKKIGLKRQDLGNQIEDILTIILSSLRLRNLKKVSNYQQKSERNPTKYPELDIVLYTEKDVFLIESKYWIYPRLSELENDMEKFINKPGTFLNVLDEFGLNKDYKVHPVIYSPYYPLSEFRNIPVKSNLFDLTNFLLEYADFQQPDFVEKINSTRISLLDFNFIDESYLTPGVDVHSVLGGKYHQTLRYYGVDKDIPANLFRISDITYLGLEDESTLVAYSYPSNLERGEGHQIQVFLDDYTRIRIENSSLFPGDVIRALLMAGTKSWGLIILIDYMVLFHSLSELSFKPPEVREESAILVYSCTNCTDGYIGILSNRTPGYKKTIKLNCRNCHRNGKKGKTIFVNQDSTYLPPKYRDFSYVIL